MMSTHQCRAARALLGWSQEKLAREAHVGVVTVRTFEAGRTQPVPATLKAMRDALAAAGVEFIPANGGGPGVRLRKP
jgi:transcriptional regulator with XRE-family HTH domain